MQGWSVSEDKSERTEPTELKASTNSNDRRERERSDMAKEQDAGTETQRHIKIPGDNLRPRFLMRSKELREEFQVWSFTPHTDTEVGQENGRDM